jgi:integrase/recombinase XerD
MVTTTTPNRDPLHTSPNTLSLNELINRFLQSRRHLSPKSQIYYRTHLSGLSYFAKMSDWPDDPSLITRNHIRDFVAYVETEEERWLGDGRQGSYKKASPATVHHYAKVTKTFFNWCYDEDYLEESPAIRYKPPKPNYREVEPYTDEEVQAMLAVCERDIRHRNRFLGLRNLAIISIFIDTGLRLDENANIKLSDLDPKLQQVRVLGKGSKFRTVPINDEARKDLKNYLTKARLPIGEELWQNDEGGPLAQHSIKIMIKRLKKRAGVTSAGGPHRFRHYFATRYLEAGGDMNVLRLLLGHSTLYMVLRYTKFVEVRKTIGYHSGFSPLDNLRRKDKSIEYQPLDNDNWGWRPDRK